VEVAELLRAASVSTVRLHNLDIFDAVKTTLNAWSLELPGTTNIVIEVVEAANPLTAVGDRILTPAI
jgi:outer membrane protein insertion porin family